MITRLKAPVGVISPRLSYLLIVGVPLLLYLQTIGFGILNIDDNVNLIFNPHYFPFSLKSFFAFWTTPYHHLYVPVTYSIWGGLSYFSKEFFSTAFYPPLFHLFNLLIFSLSVILVYRILKELSSSLIGPLIGALFFALHPIQVESVVWISSLKGLLSGFFSFLSLLYFIKGIKSGRFHLGNIGLLFYVCSLLSKTTSLFLPVICAFLSVWVFQKKWISTLKLLLPWFIVMVIFSFIALSVYSNPSARALNLPPHLQLCFATDNFLFYLKKVVWPYPLSFDYGQTPLNVIKKPFFFVTSIITTLFILWWFWKGKVYLKVSMIIFIGGVFPVLGWIPMDTQSVSIVFDRYLFTSMLAPSLIVSKAIELKQNLIYFLIMCLIGYSFMTFHYSKHWKNSESLWKYVLLTKPDSWIAHNNLASAIERRKDYAQSLIHYKKAAELYPHCETINNVGITLYRLGLYEQAIKYLNYSLEKKPVSCANIYSNLGIFLAKQGYFERAKSFLEKATLLDPSSSLFKNNLKVVFRQFRKSLTDKKPQLRTKTQSMSQIPTIQ